MGVSGGIATAAAASAVGGIASSALSGGGGGTVTQQATIPNELKPLVRQQANTSADALARLTARLRPAAGADALVAPFNANQLAAQQQAINVAGGAGGFIPTAQQGLLSTAQGDFLFGNPAFDEAVQASIRAAQPNILSTFGRSGGTPGGLAQTAIQQAASDSFANLFNQERARQQQAQQLLPGIALTPSSILELVGGQQQQQTLAERLAPIEAQSILLNAAGQGGINLSGLIGQTQQTRNQGIGALSSGLLGALGGAQIGAGLSSGFGGGAPTQTAGQQFAAGNFGAFSPTPGFGF